jgi:hypothetical protein
MGVPPSPSAETFNGKSAPQTPGPSIGWIWTTPLPIFTAPDFRQETSASCRQAARSPYCHMPRPQPASAISKVRPPRDRRTPRFIPLNCERGL